MAGQSELRDRALRGCRDATDSDEPDQVIFDLDPRDQRFCRRAGVAARSCADVLSNIGWVPFPKTTGSPRAARCAPLSRGPDFDTVRQFARDVAEVVAADDPAYRTIEQRKDKRGERIYLDVMRNAYAQTAVAPYAVRARRHAPVATPLEWHELSARGLRADRFTIRDLPERVAQQGDPWADIATTCPLADPPDATADETPCLSYPALARAVRVVSPLPGDDGQGLERRL